MAMPPRGSLMGLAGRTAHGWLVPGDAQNAPPVVSILANGIEIGEALAEGPAPEEGAFGFSIPFDRHFLRDGHIRFEAQSEGCVFATLDQDFGVGVSDLFAGQVESVTDGRLRGWAVNLGSAELPVTVNVHLGSLWLGAAVTDQPRADIRRRFGVQAAAGFSFSIPAPFRTSKAQIFRAFYANTTIELDGSPLVFPEGRVGPSPSALAALLG